MGPRPPNTGRYRRTRLFVLTLGDSRKSVRVLIFRSRARIWAELHEKAFRRLDPLYRDVLTHYGAVALPCRAQDPDRNGKVESGVRHAQKTPLKRLRFEDLEEAQTYLDRWGTPPLMLFGPPRDPIYLRCGRLGISVPGRESLAPPVA